MMNSNTSDRILAMSMIATSPYQDGPFLFSRSFFPGKIRAKVTGRVTVRVRVIRPISFYN
jgi:hypothetical protein